MSSFTSTNAQYYLLFGVLHDSSTYTLDRSLERDMLAVVAPAPTDRWSTSGDVHHLAGLVLRIFEKAGVAFDAEGDFVQADKEQVIKDLFALHRAVKEFLNITWSGDKAQQQEIDTLVRRRWRLPHTAVASSPAAGSRRASDGGDARRRGRRPRWMGGRVLRHELHHRVVPGVRVCGSTSTCCRATFAPGCRASTRTLVVAKRCNAHAVPRAAGIDVPRDDKSPTSIADLIGSGRAGSFGNRPLPCPLRTTQPSGRRAESKEDAGVQHRRSHVNNRVVLGREVASAARVLSNLTGWGSRRPCARADTQSPPSWCCGQPPASSLQPLFFIDKRIGRSCSAESRRRQDWEKEYEAARRSARTSTPLKQRIDGHANGNFDQVSLDTARDNAASEPLHGQQASRASRWPPGRRSSARPREVLRPRRSALTRPKMFLEGNIGNRTIDKRIVARYAREMKEGRLESRTAAPSRIFDDGKSIRLMNGQHRLLAVIESGVTITVVVVEVETDAPEVFSTMDVGKEPTHAQILYDGRDSQLHVAVAGAFAKADILPRRGERIAWDSSTTRTITAAEILEWDKEQDKEPVHRRPCSCYQEATKDPAHEHLVRRPGIPGAEGEPEPPVGGWSSTTRT